MGFQAVIIADSIAAQREKLRVKTKIKTKMTIIVTKTREEITA